MFGSKIKTWMENHLGRPRKKNNKNKNVSPVDHITAGEQYKQKHAATGFTLYNSNGCLSPYRTNTNSNSSSANHTGCNSSVISSPSRRREVSPIQNHTQSRYGWQSPDREHVISPKSENYLYAPQHHSQQYLRSHHTAPNTRENSCEDNKIVCKQQHQLNCSTSSFSSLSWSTGSKEPSMHSNIIQNSNVACHSSTAATNTTSSTPTEIKSCTTVDPKQSYEDPNAVHYEEIDEIGTLIRHPEKLLDNNINVFERPKSEQLAKITRTNAVFSDNKLTQDDASTRYGRLLPSKIPNPIIVSFRTGSEECIPRNGSQFSTQSTRGDMKNFSYSQNRNSMRNKMRTGVYSGSFQNNSSPPLVSLSSPESAYSTGYSTDGTSPGAGYTTPEYYINMRTGTHYFPKSVNSLAIEAQRYKFGLNKIEEMSPIDPLPKTSFAHRNIEENYSALAKQNIFTEPYEKSTSFQAWESSENKSPLPIRNTIVLPTLKGFESPSPRQRCRIRTNPWYSTTETSSSSSTVNPSNQQQHHQQHHHSGGSLMNTSLTSSMTFSSTSSHSTSALSTIHLDQDFQRSVSPGNKNGTLGATILSINNNKHNNNIMTCVSSESSSSLTEVENIQRCYTPNTIRQKRSLQLHYNQLADPVAANNKKSQEASLAVASDDDATLNEMMGKFDESYIYEKETDILSSDSDPTDCPTDMDTGQDAGDECDTTDDLLDIDFIDTSSIQEIFEHKDNQANFGKCYYVPGSPLMVNIKTSLRMQGRTSRSLKQSNEQTIITAAANSGQRRRKRFHKTRKKSSENREHCKSPLRKQRETRSVGGTPVCLRKRVAMVEKQNFSHTTPNRLSHRSSSLVFTSVYGNRYMTVAESEKALLKADFEADVKYRQLIMEAESILLSMKNSLQSISRETPVASPRRVNPLANKRVEMIKYCEIEAKKDIQKQQQQHSPKKHFELGEQELTAAINKRIEILKLETNSPPSSPKLDQCSPRKTHLTNFINQNIHPEASVRKNSINSPLIQRKSISPVASPLPQQRCPKFLSNMSSPTLRAHNLHFSDSDQDSSNGVKLIPKPNYDGVIKDSNLIHQLQNKEHQTSLNYCPQSEPLKRKIYKNYNPSFDRNDNYSPLQEDDYYHERQKLLKHQSLKLYNTGSGEFPIHNQKLQMKLNSQDLNQLSSFDAKIDINSNTNVTSNKAALILSTIEDLKRNLEHQSIELNGLHDS